VFLDGKPLDGELLPACKEIRVDVKMPLLVTGGKINLQISEERFALQVATFYSLQLWTPQNIDIALSRAEFDVQDRILRLTMPVKSEVEEKQAEVAPEAPIKLNPVELSSHKLLYDIS
jgi:hypothetical protein